MNLNKLAREVTLKEKGKYEMTIAQVKEENDIDRGNYGICK